MNEIDDTNLDAVGGGGTFARAAGFGLGYCLQTSANFYADLPVGTIL